MKTTPTLCNTRFFAERLHAPLRSQYAWGALAPHGVYLRVWKGDVTRDAGGTEWAWIDYLDLPSKGTSGKREFRVLSRKVLA